MLVLCLTAEGCQQSRDDSGRQTDVYAIYSLMLLHPATSHGPDDNQIYLISDVTVPGTPTEPCVRPPDSETKRWAEVMEDFKLHQNVRTKLQPIFTLSKPFKLLNPAECDEFFKGRAAPHVPTSPPEDPSKNQALFQKASDLFSLGDVYFDRNHTLALTFISSWCGGLCSQSQWKVFEKGTDGTWKAKSWATCFTIA